MQSVSTFVHTRPGPESDGEHGYDDNKRQMPLVHDDHTFISVHMCAQRAQIRGDPPLHDSSDGVR